MASEFVSTISEVVTSKIGNPLEYFNQQYYGVFLPQYHFALTRLEIQQWAVYQTALHACATDSWKALSSTYQLCYLILRPFSILSWIVAQHAGRFIGEHGGKSLQSLAVSSKRLAIACVRFQMSLNRIQLLGEAGLVGLCVALYYLRKWLLKQTYWARMVAWYRAKKKNAIQSVNHFFDKLARVSKILALTIPHLIFVGLSVGIRLVFPEAVRYATYETPLLFNLSVFYPFVKTFLWVQAQRRKDKESNGSSTGSSDDKNVNEIDDNSKKTGTNTKSVAERTKQFEAINKNGEKDTPAFVTETQVMATTRYWLNYWQLYAVVQAVGHCFAMIPIVGRFLIAHPIFSFLTGECKLFFFLWVFVMEKILGSATSTSGDAFMTDARPLKLVQTFVTPLVLNLHGVVSNAITPELWHKGVVSKTKRFLDAAVFVRLLSEERRDWLVHMVEEARVLTLPSITLLMPGFVTQVGVAYVRYAVPSAKSAEAKSKATKLVYLQYWVLHCCMAGLLAYLEGIIWWIPFSTHMVFLLWCYLILPKAIRHIYAMLESDLVAFGLLPKIDDPAGAKKEISETRIARFFDWCLSWLPAADMSTSDNKKQIDGARGKEDQPEAVASDSEDSKPEKASETAESGPLSPKQSTPEVDVGEGIKDKDV